MYGALRAGASGFLLKDFGPERLLAAVAAVGGDALFAPSVTCRVEAFARRGGSGSGEPADPPPDLRALTLREVGVLKLIATGPSNADIADRLYISEATVKTHLNRTMSQLDLDSRAQAVDGPGHPRRQPPGTHASADRLEPKEDGARPLPRGRTSAAGLWGLRSNGIQRHARANSVQGKPCPCGMEVTIPQRCSRPATGGGTLDAGPHGVQRCTPVARMLPCAPRPGTDILTFGIPLGSPCQEQRGAASWAERGAPRAGANWHVRGE